MVENPFCISYWFPKLQTIGVPVPRTIIESAPSGLVGICEGENVKGFGEFINRIAKAADAIGYPCFLRSGTTSHKHGWKDSCYISKKEDIVSHVANITEFCAIADMIGLPDDTWAIREFLDLKTAFKAFYGDMPINCERRYFIKDGQVICHHPYWPYEAFDAEKKLPSDWKKQLDLLNHESKEEIKLLTELSELISKEFSGYWSLDWALANNGTWYAIDMALGERSYHWPDCSKEA